jgi:hypothetical protein
MCIICDGKVDRNATTISLYDCPILTSIKPLEKCKNLEMLYFSGYPRLTSLKGIEKCKKLKWLYCFDCPWLDFKNKNFSSNIKKLKILQRSFKKSLFRRRMVMKSIIKYLN